MNHSLSAFSNTLGLASALLLLSSPIVAVAQGPNTAAAPSNEAIATQPGDELPPTAPRFLPPMDGLALPEEEAVFTAFLAAAAGDAAFDPTKLLLAADAALAKLGSPTKFRGLVQFVRAGALLAIHRGTEATTAIEESIRLLPDFSAPLVTAASIYAYSGRPAQGADYLIRAIEKDPVSVRYVDDYEINNLLHRLDATGNERHIRVLSDRLLEIGWLGTSLSSQSNLALHAIKRRVAADDIDGARELIPRLLLPAHSAALLTSNDYRELWPAVEAWAGPRLERQWTIYLNEARERWRVIKAGKAVSDYIAALVAAGHDETLIREIRPLFANADNNYDYELIFGASPVAGALARKGRWNDVEELFAQAQKTWPLGEHANALNIAANRAKFLLFAGKAKDALVQMDEALADARRWGDEVNFDATATMMLYRACMLHGLGRDSEAAPSKVLAARILKPSMVAWLHLCFNDSEAARRVLMKGLETKTTREDVIAVVQLPSEQVQQSDFARKMQARWDTLRKDEVLLAEVRKYGRVLPFRLNDAAPPEVVSPTQ